MRLFHATLDHLVQQYQESMVLAWNGVPQTLQLRIISNLAAGISFIWYIITYLKADFILVVTFSTFKCRYNYGTNIKQYFNIQA